VSKGKCHSEVKMIWPRSDPLALARFDPATKICTMNCGPSTHDPRSEKECKFQCTDCLVVPSRDHFAVGI